MDGWIWALLIIVAIVVIGVIVWSLAAKNRGANSSDASRADTDGGAPVGGVPAAGFGAVEGTVTGVGGGATAAAGATAAGMGAAAGGVFAADANRRNDDVEVESETVSVESDEPAGSRSAEDELEPQAVPTRMDDSAYDAPANEAESVGLVEESTQTEQSEASTFSVDQSGSVDADSYDPDREPAEYVGEGSASSVTFESDLSGDESAPVDSVPLPPTGSAEFAEPTLAEPTLDVPEGTVASPELGEEAAVETESSVYVSGVDGNVESVDQVLGDVSTPSVDELIAEAESKDSAVRETLAGAQTGEAPVEDLTEGADADAAGGADTPNRDEEPPR